MTIDVKDYVIVDKEKLAALLAYADIKGHVRGVEYTAGGHEDICRNIAAPTTGLKIITEEAYYALVALPDQYAAAEHHIDHTEKALQMCWDGLQHIRTEILGCTMFDTPIPVEDLLARIADIGFTLEKHALNYEQKPAAITTATQD